MVVANPNESRFLDQVIFTRATGCWIWIGFGRGGCDDLHRYGGFQVDSVMWYAHRFSYVLFKGPIPDGLCVMHKCDIPICVNPTHLELGTRTENNADRNKKGRQAKGTRHVSRVHPEAIIRGEKHPCAKLTEDQALEILQRDKQGEWSQRLAEEFGVNRRTIRDIINRKTWTHLTLPSTED